MQKILKLPVGEIKVFLNDEEIFFEIKEQSDFEDDSQMICPEGCVDIIVDMDQLHKGDKLECKFSKGGLLDDGGDECTTNLVGVVDGYTVGMGCVDSAFVEWYVGEENNYLSYQLADITENGFVINIIDDPTKYKERYFYQIYFSVAWIKGTGDSEWELISCCTD